MTKNTCKLCFRRFASPRAMAGHMRSHSVAAPAASAAAAAAATAAAARQPISSASSASTSFTTADEDVGFRKPSSTYTLRENPKRSLREAVRSSSDRESEAESTPPRAKRASPRAARGEQEPLSSLSEADTPEEDVALSLMKLSRDSWPSAAPKETDCSDDESDDGYAPPTPPSPPRRPAPAPPVAEKRTEFQCVACKKVFRSYQALGGHRASNVRGGRGGCCAPPVNAPPLPQPHAPSPLPEQHGEEGVDAKQQPYECPHCHRVFPSGQALGGHKRSHVCGAAAAAAEQAVPASTSPSPINNPGMIDLNVEPPSEEVEVSAVSDPHFNPGL